MAVETFPGKSEMASRMRAIDWSKTDLGAPDRWPAHLRVAVSLCLTSRLPVVVYWGPHHTVLYNDAYVSFLGPAKHPRSLGRPGQECWREIWDTIGPMLEGVRYTGSATLSHDVQMFFARAVPLEEVFVRFTFGPILGPDGKTVDGIFCPCTETTEQVVGARRLETLRRLGVRPVGARSIGEAASAAAAALDDNRHDVPYAAVYGIDHDETRARRLATAGPTESVGQLPLQFDLDGAEATPWPLATVARTMVAAEAHASGAGLVLPIPGAARHRLGGLLAVGVSSHRPLDDGYRAFLQRAADHIGAAIEEARAFEEADRRKKEFLAILSQELRGPLAPLGTMVEVLKRSPQDGEVVRQAHGTIERQFSQLVRIVDDLVHPGRPADGAAAPAERAVAKTPPTPRRILVVDDDPDSLTSLSMLLELAGNETYTARNGLEAVKVAESLRPEIVLMDLGMPTLSGVEAARRMRAQSWGKGMVIVALTGRGQDEDRRTSRDAGFDAHMVKPVNHEALLDVLATLKESA
jgi:CheY-like chemotaxis protein